MSKVFGKKECFIPVRQDESRTIVSYGYEEELDGENAVWHELYFYRKQYPTLTLRQMKDAVHEDINRQTDAKILRGFTWTPEDDEPINVWLSEENQRNFSEAERIAESMPQVILPVTFKLGEDKDGEAVYHEFTTSAELTQFYLQAVGYINQCLSDGWVRKDGIDWKPYEQAIEDYGWNKRVPYRPFQAES